MPPLLLLAQCTTSAPCELPSGLPWYFGALIAIVWLGVVVGILLLGRRMLSQRISRRRSDQRQLEQTTPRNELEPW